MRRARSIGRSLASRRSRPKKIPAKRPIARWAEKVGWRTRVKAVCKPCWELKYCPYGPLVEDFPLKKERDHQSCRVFGHDCPVFYVAEPCTETKELRNISRRIPRPVQFRVLKRENQICMECGVSVRDAEIHFDHIIPWSKGGASDEANIRLLCGPCNRAKGADFENRCLVRSSRDHIMEPAGLELLKFMKLEVQFAHDHRQLRGQLPTGKEIARHFGVKHSEDEELAARVISDLARFFEGSPPPEVHIKAFEALKVRWGYADNKMTSLLAAAERCKIAPQTLLAEEIELVDWLGWRVSESSSIRRKWAAL